MTRKGSKVAELTNLESKLGEVIGLAMAAQDSTKKVSRLAKKEGHDDLVQTLQTMAEEAAQAERGATQIAEGIEGKKTAILKEARSVKTKARDMMSTYLDRDADALDGFEFLTMAEASEVGHWSVLEKLNERARNPQLDELIQQQVEIQRRHLRDTMEGSLELAAEEDPNEAA
jgi:hypothetical protein